MHKHPTFTHSQIRFLQLQLSGDSSSCAVCNMREAIQLKVSSNSLLEPKFAALHDDTNFDYQDQHHVALRCCDEESYIAVRPVRLATHSTNKRENIIKFGRQVYWIDWKRCDCIRRNIWMQMRINKLWIIWTTICVSRAHFITIFPSYRVQPPHQAMK